MLQEQHQNQTVEIDHIFIEYTLHNGIAKLQSASPAIRTSAYPKTLTKNRVLESCGIHTFLHARYIRVVFTKVNQALQCYDIEIGVGYLAARFPVKFKGLLELLFQVVEHELLDLLCIERVDGLVLRSTKGQCLITSRQSNRPVENDEEDWLQDLRRRLSQAAG